MEDGAVTNKLTFRKVLTCFEQIGWVFGDNQGIILLISL